MTSIATTSKYKKNADYRRRNREKGLCTICGRPPKPNRKLCETCSQKRAKLAHNHRVRRVSQCKCALCSSPIKSRQKLCDRCRTYYNAKQKARYAKRTEISIEERERKKKLKQLIKVEKVLPVYLRREQAASRKRREYVKLLDLERSYLNPQQEELQDVTHPFDKPTTAQPGSEEKIRVLQWRLDNGRNMHHPEDANIFDSFEDSYRPS